MNQKIEFLKANPFFADTFSDALVFIDYAHSVGVNVNSAIKNLINSERLATMVEEDESLPGIKSTYSHRRVTPKIFS